MIHPIKECVNTDVINNDTKLGDIININRSTIEDSKPNVPIVPSLIPSLSITFLDGKDEIRELRNKRRRQAITPS